MSDPEFVIEQALFDAALGLPDAALRARFLDQVCAGDPDLRAQIEVLLADHARADAFFDFVPSLPVVESSPGPAPVPVLASLAPEGVGGEADEAAPARIGRYRIVRRLGEGGCGVVYLAEQDEPVRRQVALKVIRLGMDTERVIARFALERQALALMNHPHIARVLDAGATEKGRPFFVMELVVGERITTYCDTRRLSLRERLELFILVCHAVQHAHQKGIIHRDLKPSNVLVTFQDGVAVPKIIDFGVAKAISGRADDDRETVAGDQFIGTPAYMSPEQAEPGRQDMDTRSDLYSLGALLYELLAGRPPFDTQRLLAAGLDELRRTLREVEPLRPSVLVQGLPAIEQAALAARMRCAPAALLAALRRDLDWVVLQVLAKDRQHRYVTVQGLALDLRNYLDDEPVAARPPTRTYQLGKLLRRHRVVFLAGAAVVIALLGGLGASTWLYFREREAVREQMRLRAEAEDAERITHAVYLVREGSMDEAHAILATVRQPPDRPSFEGVTAYRAIGDWLAGRQRWAQAADRFSVVEQVGQLDAWDSVTRDYQSFGVALLMCGDLPRYERFRLEHARRFAEATNSDAVSRVLKMCLLRPPDAASLQRLRPLGERAEHWFAGLTPKATAGWAAIPIALWRYRNGDAHGAAHSARLGYDARDHTSARTATLRVLLALCALDAGRESDARTLIDVARADITAKFGDELGGGGGAEGYWYDWAFAYVLLEEATEILSTRR